MGAREIGLQEIWRFAKIKGTCWGVPMRRFVMFKVYIGVIDFTGIAGFCTVSYPPLTFCSYHGIILPNMPLLATPA